MLENEAYFEDGKLHIKIDGEIESVRGSLTDRKPYKFTHKGRDYYYFYEETEEVITLCFYPLYTFENQVITIEKDVKKQESRLKY